jgi:F-type H+-transporting ATPase subunit b
VKRPDSKRMRLSALFAAGTTVVLLSSVAGQAVAAGGGGHDGPPPVGAWITLGFTFFNFFLFIWILRRFAWPPVVRFLANRHQEVKDAMAVAEKARAEAEEVKREYALKEAALEETRARMIEEIRAAAVSDRAKALREAEAIAGRLRSEVERQAENELARARRELRAEAARLAAELAEKELRGTMTAADRTRLVREFVEGVAQP